MSPQQEARIAEALRHVEMGFAVMSVWSTDEAGVCKCGKPHTGDEHSVGKHPIPRDGFKAASTDPKVVETMLRAGSEPNYGIVWPEDSPKGVVLEWDVDGKDWKAKIDVLKATFGPLPPTKTTRSPSGGLHIFYRWPDGVPVPDGNTFHGFVVRWPWKGYVVGPGSRINGTMYTDVGNRPIAELPVSWAVLGPIPGAKEPLITVSGEVSGYELPESVPTGSRHAEITRFVASRWNRGLSKAEIAAGVREVLIPLFEEPASPEKIQRDIDEAWDTAQKKWGEPGSRGEPPPTVEIGDQTTPTAGREVVEVGLLPASVPVVPLAMRPEAFTTSVQLGMLVKGHWPTRTDAPDESLLVASLTYLGVLMGHMPTAFYGSREQHTSIFSMLVGTTGKSRKGTTVDLVSSALAQCTDGVRGLRQSANSGEGLIALAAKRDGEPFLIVEEEFDRLMAAKARDNATLGSILRQAFDDVPLSSSTSQRTVYAADHHIGLLGNVTREEVVEKMAQVDLKNGFANRILWSAAIPTGRTVTVHDNALDTATRDVIKSALRWTNSLTKPLVGGTTHQIDPAARDMLTAAAGRYEGVGMSSFLSRRLDTVACRIALIYACLDETRAISVAHVEAALAVTDYAFASAAWVFPETTGDVRADFVLRHLRVAGFLNYTELEALIGKRAIDRQQVFDRLGDMGYARQTTRPRRDGKPGAPQKGIEIT